MHATTRGGSKTVSDDPRSARSVTLPDSYTYPTEICAGFTANLTVGPPISCPAMRESDLLAHIARRSAELQRQFPQVLIGPGDDCAHVAAGPGGVLVSVDHVIEGRHVSGPLLEGATPLELVARKAIARSVSDLAAMAGTPQWALATAALPGDWPQAMADELFDHMHKWANHFGCPLVGGDIATQASGAALVLTTTVAGTPHKTRGPVRRDGACVGDDVWVTGRLGGSFASGRHLTFEPRVREAIALADLLGDRLHAMIDVSDGLGRDSARIGAASRVMLRLQQARVPLHDGSVSPHEGEDHELLFTVAADAVMPAMIAGMELTKIGTVSAANGAGGCVMIESDGRVIDVAELGWDHAGGIGRVMNSGA